jgi:uncharacterized coiled-coil protein SlyX
MPTGYTHKVCDGEITEFSDFAMSCARAFGALITMRDDPMDKNVPDEIAPETSYYDMQVAENLKRMGEVQAMTNAEADVAAAAEHAAALASRSKYLADKDEEAARLNAMLMKVRKWHPPTPDHVEMKSFMIDQLTISMPGSYAPSMPVELDGQTWRKKTIDDLSETIVRHRQEIAKEVERAAGRTKWLKALRSSLDLSHLRTEPASPEPSQEADRG